MFQDFKDEVLDPSLQPDTNPRYTIKDNNGKVISDDVQIEMKTPVVQQGTPINRALLLKIFGMNNYELLNYIGQEFEGIPTTATQIFGQLDNATSMANKWTGHVIGKVDINKWDFYIEGEGQPLQLGDYNSQQDRTMIGVEVASSSGTKYTLEAMNEFLRNATYDTDVGCFIYSMGRPKINFVWDLKQACQPTFRYAWDYDASLSTKPSMKFYGSNNGSSWTVIETMSTTLEGKAIIPTTAYRYYKAELQMNSKTVGVTYNRADIRYMYFANVADTVESYRTKFTSENNFEITNCIKVTAPSGIPNADKISSSVINNIPCELAITSDEFYWIRYTGEKIVKDSGAKYVTGSFVSSNILQKIYLSFAPDIVIVYASNNNYERVAFSRTGEPFWSHVPRILTKAYLSPDNYGQITDFGFTFRGYGSETPVEYYIAIKF